MEIIAENHYRIRNTAIRNLIFDRNNANIDLLMVHFNMNIRDQREREVVRREILYASRYRDAHLLRQPNRRCK